MVYLMNKKRVIYFPPPKDEKVIVLDLTKFKSMPKPKEIIKPIIKPKLKPKVKRRKVKKDRVIKRKKRDTKKRVLVAKESTQDNNQTKTAKKSSLANKLKREREKKRREKREIEAKKRRVAQLKKMEREMRARDAKREAKIRKEAKRGRERRYSSSLANNLMNGGKAHSFNRGATRTLTGNSSTRLINKLYGHEFDSYSSDQKRFLKANLGRIHAITQRALSRNGYPESAVRMGLEGVNVVSFYLHPNGNITKLKLDRSMGHSSLDNNTLRVIRIAYSNYPLPKVTTKIKFFVNYTID